MEAAVSILFGLLMIYAILGGAITLAEGIVNSLFGEQ